MRKIPASISVCLVLFLFILSSCTTIESYIENADTDYTKIPITIGQSLVKRTITLSNYRLSLEKTVNRKEDLPKTSIFDLFSNDNSTISGGKYAFTKDNEQLCEVYIYTKTKEQKKGKQTTGSVSRYVAIVKGTKDIQENEIVHHFGSNTILTVADKEFTIEIQDYDLSNNKVANNLKVLTGYKILTNGKEYGILAFYKLPILYELKSSQLDDPSHKDNIFLGAVLDKI
jgi:hypothetical protein